MTAQEGESVGGADPAAAPPEQPVLAPATAPTAPLVTARDTALLRRAVPRAWSLWALPRPVVAFVLAVDALAAVVAAGALVGPAPRGADVAVGAILVLGVTLHLEAVRRIERVREVNSGLAPYVDAKSTWSFAAVVVLPLGPALAVAAFTFAWWWWRVSQRPPPHRWLYTVSTVVLASALAHSVLGLDPHGGIGALTSGPFGLLLLAGAVLSRWAVNHGLVVAVISMVAPTTPWRRRLGSATDNLIGVGALALGVALASLVHLTPWLAPVVLLPVVGLHRGVLLPQFARAAQSDPKTGLANAAHWSDRAAREIARVRRRPDGGRLGVLMVDLDQFKRVNDEHGHLVGDDILRSVADLLRGEVRSYDMAGRFGGEEFVVLLPDAGLDEVLVVGERLRERIGAMEPVVPGGVVRGLSASVGAAVHPAHGDDVDALLTAADSALYAAKRAGRNRVEVATTG